MANQNKQKKQDDVFGKYRVKKLSFFRRMMINSLEAIPPGHNMMALLEFDVTEARAALRILRKSGRKGSLFAYIIKSIAMALADNKELNSVCGKRKVVQFDDVDVNLPVELDNEEEKFPRQVVIRKASEKTVEEIYLEIEEARKQHREVGDTGLEDKKAMRMMRVMSIIPRFIRNWILKAMMSNPLTVKRMSGTTFVTSVGSFAKIPGFVLPYFGGPRAVAFALGSVVRKPVIKNKEIMDREFLSMTIIFNHDIVDGAPAARFSNQLKKIIEKAEIF